MEFVRFLLVGSINTTIGLSCIFFSMKFLQTDYRVANGIGYVIGFLIGFFLNRSWTFQDEGRLWSGLTRWLTVVVICYTINLLVVIGLYDWIGMNIYLAQIGGATVYTGLAFLGGRLFAFKSPRQRIIEGKL